MKSAVLKLKLNGKQLDLRPLPPTASRIKEYLESLPDNELKTTEQIAEATQIALSTIKSNNAYASHLGDHRQPVRSLNRTLWGNIKAIAELRRQLGGK